MSFIKDVWREAPGGKAVLLLVVGLLVVSVYVQIGTSTTHTACVAKGYPDYYVTWTLERFCIKRVNQTDVVARLDTLR